MTENLIILPVIFQLGIAVLLLISWNKVNVQRIISLGGGIGAVVISAALFSQVWESGILTMQAGNWKAPFGITFVADTLGATMVMLTAIAGFAVSVFSQASISFQRMRFGFFPIYHLLLMGLNGAFLTGDIFNLYVWFEIVIISSFVLMTIGGEKQQIEGGIKYLTMNMLASIIFLTAIGILYGLVGTLNMADLSLKVPNVENKVLVQLVALLFFTGFGIKSALFPLYFWLPSSYHTPPSAIVGIFAGLLTKVGVYALFRIFSLIFVSDPFLYDMMSIIAALTLIAGAIGALIQRNIRRMFSYLIVCHIGYMIAALGMNTEMAFKGGVFYLIQDIILKTNLFLIIGLIVKMAGSARISDLGGLYKTHPLLSIVMAIVLFSLAGTPPLSGFWPKIFLFESAFDTGSYFLLGAMLVASFLTLYLVAKIWIEVFWKPPANVPVPAGSTTFDVLPLRKKVVLIAPVLLLTGVTVYIGFGADNILMTAERIAANMTSRAAYIQAVLGDAMFIK